MEYEIMQNTCYLIMKTHIRWGGYEILFNIIIKKYHKALNISDISYN